MARIKKTTLHIKGMHCPSCEILIKDRFREEANIQDVKPQFRTQKVEIFYTGDLKREKLDGKIRPFGYQIVDANVLHPEQQEPLANRIFHSGAIAIFIFILYFFVQELGLVPSLNLSGNLSLISVFLLGLVASASTCMATSGALFLATVGKLNRNILTGISFNLGRVISYGLFGFLAGFIGKALVANLQLGSILTLIIALFMMVIGLDMAKIISLQRYFFPSFTAGLFERLEHILIKRPKQTSFFLGAITYLLPCGFTQTVQLYALGLGDPMKSALVMIVFALGTVPALLAIGFVSNIAQFSLYSSISRVMGVIIIMVGMLYFSNIFALYGISPSVFGVGTNQRVLNNSNISFKDGTQIASMNVNASGYYPNNFVVKKNIPVRWEINGENVFGCQGYLVVPKLGIQKLLERGRNVIEFTPKESGLIGFSCGMGMYRGSFSVVDS